jgi:DNA-binding LacI/PurR family transcriptional regulator
MVATAPSRIRTIADLASLAGVSAGTVSRALAGKAEVNDATRRRIEALAAEHGFRPNQMASRLRRGRTGVVGVVVPLGHEKRQHLSDPFFMAILAELADALTENGYDIMLSRVIPDDPGWLDRIATSGMLDGVMLIGQSDEHHAIERLARTYLPLVAWGVVLPGQAHCAVGSDNLAGGRLAGDHLVERGARRLAFLGDIRAPEFRLRYEGVCAAAHAARLLAPLQLDVHLASDIMEHEIEAHLPALFDGGIDGLACASDLLAVTAIRLLKGRGVPVPGAVRVTGYDDLPLAAYNAPALTTVAQDIAAGARDMVSALFRRIDGEPAPSVQLAPTLVLRGST